MLPTILIAGLFALAQSTPTTGAHPAFERRTPVNTKEVQVLQDFAKTVNGPTKIKARWAGHDVCKWSGVFCKNLKKFGERVVYGIEFNKFSLTGSLKLEGFLDKLLFLQFFHANKNGFRGPIPDLSGLRDLYQLDLSDNQLSGSFPSQVLTAPKLSYLDLRFNKLHGSLPKEIFELNMDFLALNDNRFSGSLPSSIGHYPGAYLVLANNNFTDSIPSALGDAKNIQEILLLGNRLNGSLPSGLGKMTNLKVFDASQNQLDGDIPEDLCAIETLEHLVLTDNKFKRKQHLGPKCKAAKRNGVLEF